MGLNGTGPPVHGFFFNRKSCSATLSTDSGLCHCGSRDTNKPQALRDQGVRALYMQRAAYSYRWIFNWVLHACAVQGSTVYYYLESEQ